MKRMTKLCAFLLVLGLALGIGGFAAGGKLYGWNQGRLMPLWGQAGGWFSGHGAALWPWDNDDWRWPWDDDRDKENTADTEGLPELPDMDSAAFAAWRQSLTRVPVSEDFTRISLDLGAAECVILQGSALEVYTRRIDAAVDRNGTLRISTPRGKLWKTQRVLLVVPPNLSGAEISIDAGASALYIDALSCKSLLLDAGAAAIKIGSLNAASEISVETGASSVEVGALNCRVFDLDAGAASVRIDRLYADEASFEVGMGALDVGLLDSRETDLSCTGTANLTLTGREADYTLDSESTMGTLQIGRTGAMRKITGTQQAGRGARQLEVEVSMGAVNLVFEG